MLKETRLNFAKACGIIDDIGKKVIANHDYAFRSGDTAEIVGWRINPETRRPQYIIKFDDGECDMIPAGTAFKDSGFKFISN